MTLSFADELGQVATRVRRIFCESTLRPAFAPEELLEATLAYPSAGGKALRPALLLWSCRALDGPEHAAVHAGAAVELYHTYTLVHDDIIDRDPLRRGRPSVHARLAEIGSTRFGLNEADAAHYGLSMAILAGNCLHSWALDLLHSIYDLDVPHATVTALARRLEGIVGPAILEGEARDIQLPFTPVAEVTDDAILRVILTKTSALFSYCGWAGGLLARGREDEHVRALAAFAERAGIAFQLQDDVLGLTADSETLGKPVGNDLREGKRTLIISLGWARADETQRAQLTAVLGNQHATDAEVRAATALLETLGAVADVQAIATRYLTEALIHLGAVPASDATRLLRELAERMVQRVK
jgi:geranylgeranyl diphosphate synthase type I